MVYLCVDSCVLNPKGRYYERLVEVLLTDYEDNYWLEDAIFMERNSRDFVIRNQRINANAEAVCGILKSSPHGKVDRVAHDSYGY